MIVEKTLQSSDATLCKLSLVERSKKGSVYIVTSPLLDAVKIGMWTGTDKSLRGRYLTSYGPDLEITVFRSPDCRQLETAAHRALDEYRLYPKCELFEKGATDYKAVIRKVQQFQEA